MRLNQIDLNLFIVLDAIYQQRNLTRASEVLSITQPAVSNALARLRNTLNDPLFVRTSQGMTPTPLVENMIGRVQEGLQLFNTSVSEGEVFQPEEADKTFRLSMNGLAEATLLPSLLERLQSVAPNIGIECYQVKRDDIEREMAAGTLDFALDIPLVASSQLCTVPLLQQEYACLVRRNHPTVGKKITLKQYLALDHIVVSSRRKGMSYEDSALHRLGHKRQIRTRVQHHQLAPLLVEQTDLALTMPTSISQKYNLKILALPFSLPALAWSLFWHKSADYDQANLWMRQLIIDSCYQHSFDHT